MIFGAHHRRFSSFSNIANMAKVLEIVGIIEVGTFSCIFVCGSFFYLPGAPFLIDFGVLLETLGRLVGDF